jgi:serine/threonine protein phosphatase 1
MYFPIGDLHGRCDLAELMYDKIKKLVTDGIDPAWGGTVVWLGDYIDRGPQAKELLDFLMTLPTEEENGIKNIFLRGNHEHMMTENFKYFEEQTWGMWMYPNNGGPDTLASFGINPEKEELVGHPKLAPYVEWIDTLPYIYTADDYVFVHAGIDPTTRPEHQTEITCLWGRGGFPRGTEYEFYRKIIVHGHYTHWSGPKIAPERNQIAMDIGACKTGRACTVGLPQFYDGEKGADLEVHWVYNNP